MTVQYEWHSWQANPMQPDPKKCAPIMQSWWTYLRTHWGGQHLGCYARRPVVGGAALSSHASGAAMDWRYQDPGAGRTAMLAEAMPFLLNNSRELGLTAIHDYAGRRIWRPPNCSGRPGSPSPECGWRASSGPQMHPANLWLHIEVHPSRWSDTRTVAEMLGTDVPPTQPPTQPPPSGGTFTLELQKNELTPAKRDQLRGNGDVYLIQQIAQGHYKQLGNSAFDCGTPDGDYGPRTQEAVRELQRIGGLTVDGNCGNQTWSYYLNKAGT